ncbi:multicopper oxidase family protein [Longispora sp. K20-0274]|uniref:multicopper oxidase family protein n=1 Tax=Longispora sp. K20-0274 TaxID=3088255 RepID=UPI003999F3DB
MSRRVRLAVAVVATVAIVGPLGWAWQDSLLPSSYSVMDFGRADLGGSSGAAHVHGGPSVADLVGPVGAPDVAVTLTARRETITLGGGERLSGYTVNHQSPGPVLRVTEGQVVAVTLVNESVADGVTLHWHGVDLPNAEDGVAGVTQDAVPRGGSHVYRFRAEHPGTYWYHSHQVSHEQVRQGLYGVLVIEPAVPDPDVVAAVHTYANLRTVAGRTGLSRIDATGPLRLRVVNTDNDTVRVVVNGAPYRLLALDGRDLHEPGELAAEAVTVPAGGRADLGLVVPATGPAVRVDLGGVGLVLGPPGAAPAPARAPTGTVDPLRYGTPAPLGLDPDHADRRFTLRIGRFPGFVDGRPGVWWTLNGELYPNTPMFVVREGDTVVMTLVNGSGKSHPLHLHGHHAVLLGRDGVPATGSPVWRDSLDVPAGSTYVLAFRADNPGIWMDHCHNLDHAAQGLVAHLAYEGVTEPYRVGGRNEPE